MHATPIIHDLHAWLRWCTGRSMSAARTLTEQELHRPFEMGLGSVFATLLHLYGAERLWILVIQGETEGLSMPTQNEFPTLDAIAKDWPRVRKQWDALLDAPSDAELTRNVVRVRDGREYRQRVLDALVQLPTHALYHNAQLSSMFRQMGKQLPDSSYIIWAREQADARTGAAAAIRA
ncbi:MAG: DinB family protein [Phycisphaerae bacterium]|nr:DinB family protein [Phycisphaerae bacterium]